MGLKHLSTESCSNYLPKPRYWHKGLIAQCSWCKKLFVCQHTGYGAYWTELND